VTDYFVDYTNGLDTNTGLKYDSYVVESTADTTHFVDASLHGICTIGCFIWVDGRSGSLVSAFDDGTHTVTLATAIAGLTANDTFTMIAPFKTVNTFTSNVGRSPGDNCYLRTQADHDSSGADITTGSQVTVSQSRISLIGCSTADSTDFWHDGTTTRATITFGGNAYQMIFSKNYWYAKNIRFYNGADTANLVYCNTVYNVSFYNCLFKNDGQAHHPFYSIYSVDIYLDTCTFEGGANSGGTSSCSLNQCTVRLVNCTFNATVATTYGLAVAGGTASCYNCTWGNTNTYNLYDVYAYYGGRIYLQNCRVYGTVYSVGYSAVFAEDYDNTFGQHKRYQGTRGNVTKTTSVLHTGGATSSALMEPGSASGLNMPLKLFHLEPYYSEGFKIWRDAVPTTVTIYMRAYGSWGTFPTASELYIKAWYLTSDSTAARDYSTASTQVLDNDTTWVAFTTTFTPGRSGFAYVNVYLAKYAANCGCYVDTKIVVS
jgi:hypothetical protein